MRFSLYNYYKDSPLNFLKITEDYVERFYLRDHSEKKFESIAKAVYESSKIEKLLDLSIGLNFPKDDIFIKPPKSEYFMSTICSMFKFMFASTDTVVMATLLAEDLWMRKAFLLGRFFSPEECKTEFLKVFDKYQVYKEMTEEEYFMMTQPIKKQVQPQRTEELPDSVEKIGEHNKPYILTYGPTLMMELTEPERVWSLIDFIYQYGNLQVKPYFDSETNKTIKVCVCTTDNMKTYINFSTAIGELTIEEIAKRKEDLLVKKFSSGYYILTVTDDKLPIF